MNRFALLASLILAPALLPGASKEMIELQRDVAQMQEQIRLLQQSFDSKVAQILVLAQQSLDATGRSNQNVTDLSRVVNSSGADIGKQVVQPIATLSSRVDQLAQDMAGVQQTVADQTATLNKIQAQLLDLKNAISTMQAPAAAPPPSSAPPSTMPLGSAGPTATAPAVPIGPEPSSPGVPPIPNALLYQNAKRDMDGGNNDLALNEFNDYLRYYRATDLAPNAQFNIGQIHYNQKKFDLAVHDFDQVLEAFPQNPKTPDAHFMKGRALIQLGRRNDAAKEFNVVITQFPNSTAAGGARVSLRALGLSPAAPAAPARRKR